MANRLKYVDDLKGIAILFMVMGHVMQISLGVGNVAFNKFYTSFHMPIFMALSGLFVYKYFIKWTLSEYIYFLLNKIKRILLPFFVVGGLYSYLYIGNIKCLLDGSFNGYWFLPALFICMLLDVSVSFILRKINLSTNIFADIIARLLVWILSIALFYFCVPYSYLRGAIYHYPFFVIGIMMIKYKWIGQNILHNKNLISIFVLIYLLIWIFVEKNPLHFNILGLFSIPILIFLFSNLSDYIHHSICTLGRYSLEIYVFHRFLLPSMLNIGSIMSICIAPSDKSQNFILFLLLSLLISLPICIICIWIAKAIKELPIINMLLFGKKFNS